MSEEINYDLINSIYMDATLLHEKRDAFEHYKQAAHELVEAWKKLQQAWQLLPRLGMLLVDNIMDDHVKSKGKVETEELPDLADLWAKPDVGLFLHHPDINNFLVNIRNTSVYAHDLLLPDRTAGGGSERTDTEFEQMAIGMVIEYLNSKLPEAEKLTVGVTRPEWGDGPKLQGHLAKAGIEVSLETCRKVLKARWMER